ncbi:MAG: LapA family protein [Pseudobdellovibrionaceae bacterium]
MTGFLKFVVTLLILSLFFWIILFNHSAVDVALPPFTEGETLSLGFILLGALIVGFIWGGFIVALHDMPVRRELRRLAKENKRLNEEIESGGKHGRVVL